MNQYFIESNEPIYFHFNVVIQNHEIDLAFDSIINNLQENFERKQEECWLNFWKEQGEKQVLETWNEKYKDYLEEDKEEYVNEKKPSGEEKQEVKVLEVQPQEQERADSTLLEKSWEDLWNEHEKNIYCEQYKIFQAIFYSYFLQLTRSCELEKSTLEDIDEFRREESYTRVESDNVELSKELKQLSLLGLPTSFGGRPQNSSKKLKSGKNSFIGNELGESEMENYNLHVDIEVKGKEEALHNVRHKSTSKVQKIVSNRKLKNVPAFMLEEKGLLKYWRKRFSLFSRFDEGIRLDRESWFSVTPEKVAKHLADRLKCDVIVDGFCGSGGNIIQFAFTCNKVIGIDIDPIKLEMAKHNAKIYEVSHKIEFILGDFLQISACGKLKADAIFISPPWGGPKYKNKKEFDIEKYLLPVNASELFKACRNVSNNVALFLPRNSNPKQIVKLAGIGNRCEIEYNYLDSRLVALTALYGEEILSRDDKLSAF